MLKDLERSPAGGERTSIRPQRSAAYDLIEGDLSHGLILLCDHASNALPEGYGSLGLPPSELERHIGYDIGVDGITRRLAQRLGLPAVLTRYSRLLIDPNRGLDDPTLIMRISDGAVVPGNAELDETERQDRIRLYYKPYHDAVARLIDRSVAMGHVPALLSIHSFTPLWKGIPRPWHAGVLWKPQDPRFAAPLLAALGRDESLCIGDNEPYHGGLAGDTLDRHGHRKRLANALIEIRQDLIVREDGIEEWADRLAELLPAIIADPTLHRFREAA